MDAAEDTTVKSLPTKVEEVALQIGASLAGSQVYRTSIHDATGHTVWISAGNIDRTEHGFVLDALDCFALEPARSSFERETGGHVDGLELHRQARGDGGTGRARGLDV